jgi:hypothetical protein
MVRWKKWMLSSVMGEPRGVIEIGRGGGAVFRSSTSTTFTAAPAVP